MLPTPFSPTGDYSERQLDRARGYLLLAHAELESYFEDRAWEVVTSAITNWKRDKKPRTALMALLAFTDWKATPDIEETLGSAGSAFYHSLERNHGITEDNLLDMLLPVGVPRTSIDAGWLSTAGSLAIQRGAAAHSAVSSTPRIDPKSTFDTVTLVLEGIKPLDIIYSKLAGE